MKERRIEIICNDLTLEGLYHGNQGSHGVVITHPHPQYGGDMTSPVVEAITAAYQRRGYSTLRFNFRGAGASDGHFAHGIGEQDDVRAAVSFLRSKGIALPHLSGYSFGAWVNAMTVQDGMAIEGMTMVAPPVAFIAFDEAVRLPMLSVVVAGSRDDFAPPSLIRTAMVRWNPKARLEIINDADHFFFGFLDPVTRILVQGLQ